MLRSRFALLLLVASLTLSACDSGMPNPNDIRRVFITQISIDDAPLFQPDGERWDGGILPSGPDLYVELVNDDTGTLVESYDGADFSDVDTQDFPLIYDLGTVDFPEIEFTRFSTSLAFDVYDEDPTTEDDYIGSTEAFNLQDLIDSGLPNFVRLESADGEIQISFRLRYQD